MEENPGTLLNRYLGIDFNVGCGRSGVDERDVSYGLGADNSLPPWGRTIRKVIGGGGGGEFSDCTNFFFFSVTTCAGIFFFFFQVKPSASPLPPPLPSIF